MASDQSRCEKQENGKWQVNFDRKMQGLDRLITYHLIDDIIEMIMNNCHLWCYLPSWYAYRWLHIDLTNESFSLIRNWNKFGLSKFGFCFGSVTFWIIFGLIGWFSIWINLGQLMFGPIKLSCKKKLHFRKLQVEFGSIWCTYEYRYATFDMSFKFFDSFTRVVSPSTYICNTELNTCFNYEFIIVLLIVLVLLFLLIILHKFFFFFLFQKAIDEFPP